MTATPHKAGDPVRFLGCNILYGHGHRERAVRFSSLLSGLSLLALAAPLLAQTAPAPRAAPVRAPTGDDSAYDPEDIVVTGQPPRGSVVGDIKPEITLSPADIRSYGVNNISDLLDELALQTGSDRGRGGGAPVVLLNGRRISGFGEIRDLPTEAIQRVEILPEEVSLKYGYAADQRVVNIVLRRRFRAIIGQAGGGIATEGGGESANPEANLVRIHNDQRFSVNLRYQGSEQLLESQRNLTSLASGQPFDLTGNVAPARGAGPEIDPALSALAGRPVTIAGVPASAATGAPTLAAFVPTADQPNATAVSRYRTLRPTSNTLSTNIVYAHPVFARATATVNGSLSYATSDALQGLPGTALTVPAGDPFSPFADPVTLYRYLGTDPLRQRTDTLTAHLGTTLNGDRGHWRWSLTGTYDRTATNTRTGTGIDTSELQGRLDALDPMVNPFGVPTLLGGVLTNRANAVTNTGELNAVVGGPLFHLPAGSVGSNFRVGFQDNQFDGTSMRAGLEQDSSLGRRNVNSQVNLDFPLTSRKEHVLSAIGNLSANVNVAVRQLSDFGTLHTIGYGLHWVPVTPIDLIASVTNDQGAPTVQQLGNPQVVTPQVRVFDYLTGQTVDVTQINGGNRALRHDDRRVMKLGLTLKPFPNNDLTIIANYLATRTRNAIATLPEPTTDILNAFPDRFVRDASGTLVRFDTSPVNFARERQDELRIGFNFSVSLKSVMQRKFEEWIAARRAGKDVPPPFPIPERFRRRAQAAGNPGGGAPGADGAPPPPPDGAPPPPPGDGGGPPPGERFGGGGGGGGFGGPGGGGGGGGGGGPGGFGGGRGGRGGFGGRGGQQASGRLQVALYDTWTLKDTVLIREGVPLIDLLHGGSVTSGGGQPEHKVELQLGYFNNGLGVRVSGNYQTATRVNSVDGMNDLRFSGLATANLRMFADLGQVPSLVGKGWARGLRIGLELINLADSRQRVRDANGDTPLRYQPAYLDPLGRVVRVTIRKLLF